MADRPAERIDTSGNDEVGRLARAFETLTGRLEERVDTITADRNKLRAVLSGMVEGVVAVDSAERILLFNDVASRMFNQDSSRVVGRPIWEVLRWPRLTDAVTECLSRDEPRQFEASLPQSTSERNIEVQVQVAPLHDARNQLAGATLIMHDITRLRQLEQMRRDFVANVSHELKTPLTAIKGLCETMIGDRGMEPDRSQSFLEKIAKQTDRLSNLVRDLLTLSRLDEDRYLARPEPCDWTRILQEAFRDLLPRAERKGLTMGVQVPSQAVVVRAEPEALRQVVDNLVDNAIKYTPAGGEVSVLLGVEEDRAVLRVVDTGIGLAVEDQQRVFERFYRVDKARSRELGGTGLGLSIVKNIVLNLAGDVRLESAPGRGSTFSVSIPLFLLPPATE